MRLAVLRESSGSRMQLARLRTYVWLRVLYILHLWDVNGRQACLKGKCACAEPFGGNRSGKVTCREADSGGPLLQRPQLRRDYPPNLSISLSGGKDTNRDSLSN